MRFEVLTAASIKTAVFRVVVLCSLVFLVSPKNDHDVDKEDGQSPSTHHTIGGRPVRVCQPGAHSQEIVPLINSHFSAVY
jgi:hypothetical protein